MHDNVHVNLHLHKMICRRDENKHLRFSSVCAITSHKRLFVLRECAYPMHIVEPLCLVFSSLRHYRLVTIDYM